MFKIMLISSIRFYKQHEPGAGNEYDFPFFCSPAQQHQRIHQFGKWEENFETMGCDDNGMATCII